MLLATFVSILALLASTAVGLAQDEDEGPIGDGTEMKISIGVGAVSIDNKSSESFKFGEYTGLFDETTFLIGDANIIYGKEGFYVDARAKDVGLDNRSAYLEAGRYAGYKLFLKYDEIPHLLAQGKVIHDGAGSDTLTLPDGFTRGANPNAMSSSLEQFKKDFDLRIDRTSMSGGLSLPVGGLTLNVTMKSEAKQGEKSIGSVVGAFSGDRRSIILPEPVDYVTNDITASLDYKTENGFIQANYYVSDFTNNTKNLFWDTPYSGNYPETSKTPLPPDNEHVRYNLTGNYSLGETTKIYGIAEFGQMKQNEDLTAYSNDPAFSGPALPRSSAEARIDTTLLKASIFSRPLPKLSVRAEYKYYKTDNKTPFDLFTYTPNDGSTASGSDSERALFNLPYDSSSNQIKLNATYNIFGRTNLKLAYINEEVERSFRAIKKTKENTYKVGVNSRLNDIMVGRLNYSVANREGEDDYDQSVLFDNYHSQDYRDSITDPDLRFTNNPEIRKFDIANRDRTKFGAKVWLFPGPIVPIASLGLYYNYVKDDYIDTILGLELYENSNYTIDVTLTPLKTLSVSAFYTSEQTKLRQLSRYYADMDSTDQSDDPDRNWLVTHYDDIPTYGFGISLKLLGGKLYLNADYSVSESTTSIQFNTGSALTVPEDMPDLKTRLAQFSLSAKYAVFANWDLGLGYEFEDFQSDDFATDGLNPLSTTLPQVLTMYGSIEDYKAHIGMAFITYHFSDIE